MILTLIYWLFVFIVIYFTGFFLRTLLLKKNSETKQIGLDGYFLTGFVFLSIFSSYVSIFLPVNHKLFMAIVLILLMLCIIYRARAVLHLSIVFRQIMSLSLFEKILLIGLFLFFILVSVKEIGVADTGIYHAQSVQWIRKYGLVPGLGNVQGQFGFNSMFFPISALFTFELKGVLDSSEILIYPLNGILLYVLIVKLLHLIKRENELENWILSIYYLVIFGLCILVLPKSISSLSNDVICAILIIYSIIYFTNNMKTISSSNILVLACLIFLCNSYKLSSLLLLLFLLPMIYQFRKFDVIPKIFIVGLIVFGAYLIRNYYMTGYLIYPFPEIDIFSTDWKIPSKQAFFEKSVIESWAKIPKRSISKVLQMPFEDWLPVWWTNKDLILKTLLLVNVSSIFSIRILFRQKKYHLTIVQGLILVNLIFWFINAPDPRFALGFLFVGFSITVLTYLEWFRNTKFMNFLLVKCILGFILVCSLFYHRSHLKNVAFQTNNIVLPSGFPDSELKKHTTNFTFNIPINKTRCNNTPIPCSQRPPGSFDNLVLRGTSIEEGFRMGKKQKTSK